jgi:hypothetical protein
MAYFAELNGSNTVLRVLVVPDNEEHRGQEFLSDDLGLGGTWVQDSTKSGGVGYTYESGADIFYGPQPYPSWALDENFVWQPPTPKPSDGEWYDWDEDTTSWVEITE